MTRDPCPFCLEGSVWLNNISPNNCIVTGKECRLDPYGYFSYHKKESWEICPIVKRVVRTLLNVRGAKRRNVDSDLRVLQHLFRKFPGGWEGKSLLQRFHVFCLSHGVNWKTIQTKIGQMLLDRCRETPACPFKALLPETDVTGETLT